jgi:hypothetical protein
MLFNPTFFRYIIKTITLLKKYMALGGEQYIFKTITCQGKSLLAFSGTLPEREVAARAARRTATRQWLPLLGSVGHLVEGDLAAYVSGLFGRPREAVRYGEKGSSSE